MNLLVSLNKIRQFRFVQQTIIHTIFLPNIESKTNAVGKKVKVPSPDRFVHKSDRCEYFAKENCVHNSLSTRYSFYL